MLIASNISSNAILQKLEDMKCCISALDATQNAIMKKLESMEKAVTLVEEDVTWVRGDVGVVHEILEKIAEHVSMLKPTVAEVEGEPEQRTIEVSAWGSWKDEAHAEDGVRTNTTLMVEDDGVHLFDEEPSHIHGGDDADNAIQETQMFDTSTGMQTNISSSVDEAGCEWWHGNRERTMDFCSPPGKQARRTVVDGELEDGTQQMEMSLELTEDGTQAPGRSVWTAFSSAAREMPAPVFGGGPSDEGWIRSKRGRGTSAEFGGVDSAKMLVEELAGHGNLNLNISPEKVDRANAMQERSRNTTIAARGVGSRGGGRGSGRGTGRVKRPPMVHPRYRSTASPQKPLHPFKFPTAYCSLFMHGWDLDRVGKLICVSLGRLSTC